MLAPLVGSECTFTCGGGGVCCDSETQQQGSSRRPAAAAKRTPESDAAAAGGGEAFRAGVQGAEAGGGSLVSLVPHLKALLLLRELHGHTSEEAREGERIANARDNGWLLQQQRHLINADTVAEAAGRQRD